MLYLMRLSRTLVEYKKNHSFKGDEGDDGCKCFKGISNIKTKLKHDSARSSFV